MKRKLVSTELNVQTAADNIGGSRFELILIAALRAREIESTRNIVERNDSQATFHNKAVTEALSEIEQGRIGREYLNKLHNSK